jgi:hypothetical protein
VAKAKIVRNSPVIKNANLIGAGNKFVPMTDGKGAIQWKASVQAQAAKGGASPTANKVHPKQPDFLDKLDAQYTKIIQQAQQKQSPGKSKSQNPTKDAPRIDR